MSHAIGRFHVVSLPEPDHLTFPALIAAARGGADVLHLRWPALSAREIVRLARELREAVAGTGARVVVNRRVDIALAAGVDGVHLPTDAMDPADARRLLGPAALIGVSVHSIDESRRAAAAGVDWVTFGHVFATPSHPDEPGRGLDALAEVVRDVAPVPVIAIGGIDAWRTADMMATGAHGIAVIRAVFDAPDPEAAAQSIRDAIDLTIRITRGAHL